MNNSSQNQNIEAALHYHESTKLSEQADEGIAKDRGIYAYFKKPIDEAMLL